jgi:hypothetical protein
VSCCRLYRIPTEDRDPTTFRIESNDFDVLHITANDMGNTGSAERDIKQVSTSFPIVVAAVNNPPQANGPKLVEVLEDVPYSIINNPDKGLYGINITDPDQTNYGFNNSRVLARGTKEYTMGFEVSCYFLSCADCHVLGFRVCLSLCVCVCVCT